jgi:RNA polymerase sigma-70 factor (sigma-E family)
MPHAGGYGKAWCWWDGMDGRGPVRPEPGRRLTGNRGDFMMTTSDALLEDTVPLPRIGGERVTLAPPPASPDTDQTAGLVADQTADVAVTELYGAHYRSLVRLAALLVRDVATAEEVVQDSFVAIHGRWRLLTDNERALAYLRRSVVNRSRSVLRHRNVVERFAPKPPPDMPSAEQGAIALVERTAVITALRLLPPRQREVLVLRYYGDLSESQIASAMGISQGAVKSHAARAMSALRSLLETEV